MDVRPLDATYADRRATVANEVAPTARALLLLVLLWGALVAFAAWHAVDTLLLATRLDPALVPETTRRSLGGVLSLAFGSAGFVLQSFVCGVSTLVLGGMSLTVRRWGGREAGTRTPFRVALALGALTLAAAIPSMRSLTTVPLAAFAAGLPLAAAAYGLAGAVGVWRARRDETRGDET